jgi:ElaB/YqjD/DUF883 family membrane-anchored ribosome-binding protein
LSTSGRGSARDLGASASGRGDLGERGGSAAGRFKDEIMSKFMDSRVGGQIKDKSQDVRDDLHDLGAIVREAVEDKFRDWSKGISDAGAKARDRATEARTAFADFIGERPIRSVLAAIAAGFLLGKVVRRR